MTDKTKSSKEEMETIRKTYSKLGKNNRCILYAKGRSIPQSYKENTLKEELILEHVIQYRKEFALSKDPKRELFLYPKNECEKYKFICTTIRPTKVPYPELYEYEKCAKFISEFIEYEELNPPNEFPKYIPSPENVLLWQIGDSFDISIVLCSLLIGAGYNAYVVYGKAPRAITTKDESNLSCPHLQDDIKIIELDLDDDKKEMPSEMEEKKIVESQYDKREQEEIEKKKADEWRRNNVIDDDQPELERHDPWLHKRIHAWVLLKKNKRIKSDIYIEAATGRIYSMQENPFESIDALFNNFNFWINLHPNKSAKETDLNFSNKDNWEFVMLNTNDNNDDLIDDEGTDENPTEIKAKNDLEDSDDLKGHGLDMPPPWPNKVYISLYSYNNRVPMSTQTFYYQKTRVDKFSPYSQPDGLIMKIYKYSDFARVILEEVEYRYRNRSDKLYKKIKRPYEHKTIDFYLPGQKFGWKNVEEVESQYRKVHFYPTNYVSGLIYREEIFQKKIIHRYISRDDRVIERKVNFQKDLSDKPTSYKNFMDNPMYERRMLITKFTQKYLANPMIPKEEQIYKLSYKFDMSTKIFLTYHYAKGKIIAKTDEFKIEENESSLTSEDKEDNYEKFNSEKDKLKKKLFLQKSDLINSFLKIEDDYFNSVIETLDYNKKIDDNRQAADGNQALFKSGILEKNIFDQDTSSNEFSKDKGRQEYDSGKQRFDRIEFFLQLEGEKMDSEKMQPNKIKEEIIKIFKDEKMDVTNILQKELKEQVMLLNKEMDEFKNKDNLNQKEIDDHNEKINDIQRRINIIYQRSHRHITKIMEELNILMAKLDQKFTNQS